MNHRYLENYKLFGIEGGRVAAFNWDPILGVIKEEGGGGVVERIFSGPYEA